MPDPAPDQEMEETPVHQGGLEIEISKGRPA